MISRVTIFSLLLALMLFFGMRYWSYGQRDACTPYLEGDIHAPSSEYVTSGTRLISVPCNDWITRQPMRVQILCLVNLGLTIVFILNALGDWRDWRAMRRRLREIPQ